MTKLQFDEHPLKFERQSTCSKGVHRYWVRDHDDNLLGRIGWDADYEVYVFRAYATVPRLFDATYLQQIADKLRSLPRPRPARSRKESP